MKNQFVNIYTLLNQNLFWKKYENKKLILKYLYKNKNNSVKNKILLNFIKWDLKKIYFISNQTNVCKKTGNFKKTFNQFGLNRHSLRFHLNENRLIHLKKLSW